MQVRAVQMVTELCLERASFCIVLVHLPEVALLPLFEEPPPPPPPRLLPQALEEEVEGGAAHLVQGAEADPAHRPLVGGGGPLQLTASRRKERQS